MIEVNLVKVEPGHYQVYVIRKINNQYYHIGGADLYGSKRESLRSAESIMENAQQKFKDEGVVLVDDTETVFKGRR